MVEIHNLNSCGKMLASQIPDPLGTVSDHDFLGCPAPAALPGFNIQPLAKLFGRLDGAGIGGGVRIANRVAFFIPTGLREHTSQLGLASVRRLAVLLAFAAH